MANYVVIGGDGKEYGPISGDDMRKWVTEGRLNAQSLAKSESDAEFRTLATFPEFAHLFGIAATQATPGYAQAAPVVDWSSRDYELDIGGCVSRGWKAATSQFGQLFLPVFIYFLIQIVISLCGKIPVIGPLFSIGNLFINGQLFAGVFYVYLLTLRGERADVGKMFDGFRRCYWQLFLGYFVAALFYLLCLVPFFIVFGIKASSFFKEVHGTSPADIQVIMSQLGPIMMSCLPILLICLVPLIYLTVNWQFALPLIIDRQMDFWTAMKTSWKMVHKHWWTVFGLIVVVGLLNMAGTLVCCVGLLFSIPFGFATLMSGYETIFGESRSD
jgi:uncharacterized membrane protein